MGVDLHRIGTGISSGTSRNGFGNIVSFPSGSSFPAYGTFNSQLYDVTYPIANGGAFVTINSTDYPSQNCDVELKNNGSGGTYTDWATAQDIVYFSSGVNFLTSLDVPLYVNVYGTNYQSGTSDIEYMWDGIGGYYYNATNEYVAYGTAYYQQTTPLYTFVSQWYNGTGQNFENGKQNTSGIYSDGAGGYYETGNQTGDYISSGTLIGSDDNYSYYWDGYGYYYY